MTEKPIHYLDFLAREADSLSNDYLQYGKAQAHIAEDVRLVHRILDRHGVGDNNDAITAKSLSSLIDRFDREMASRKQSADYKARRIFLNGFDGGKDNFYDRVFDASVGLSWLVHLRSTNAVIHHLEKTTRERLIRAMGDVPPSLFELFEQAMQQVKHPPPRTKKDKASDGRCDAIVAFVDGALNYAHTIYRSWIVEDGKHRSVGGKKRARATTTSSS